MQGPTGLVLLVALVNGLGEELFFRGALFSALGSHHPVAGTTVIYVAVTAATGNIALVVAAGVDGDSFFAAAQTHRRDLGAHGDPSLLVNAHVVGAFTMRIIESPCSEVHAP